MLWLGRTSNIQKVMTRHKWVFSLDVKHADDIVTCVSWNVHQTEQYSILFCDTRRASVGPFPQEKTSNDPISCLSLAPDAANWKKVRLPSGCQQFERYGLYSEKKTPAYHTILFFVKVWNTKQQQIQLTLTFLTDRKLRELLWQKAAVHFFTTQWYNLIGNKRATSHLVVCHVLALWKRR